MGGGQNERTVRLRFVSQMTISRYQCKITTLYIYLYIFWLKCSLNRLSFLCLPWKHSTTATLGTEESGRCGEMAVMGRKGCHMTNSL